MDIKSGCVDIVEAHTVSRHLWDMALEKLISTLEVDRICPGDFHHLCDTALAR